MIKKEIVNVLHYFNYFKYPLKLEELHWFIKFKCSIDETKVGLESLLVEKNIFFIDNSYLLENNKALVERKYRGKIYADKRLKNAKIIAKFIGAFPFVKSVSVSGSLSKGYADKTTDIDFFIITSKDNLWTCRSVLHAFKKLTFLVNMQHSFCMNYFLASSNLNLEEKNYFTAIEISTLIPLYGIKHYNDLIAKNNWVIEFLPNSNFKVQSEIKVEKHFFKKIHEFVLRSKKINMFFMNWTDKKWKKKWKKKGVTTKDYELAFKTKLYVSKNHYHNYQEKVLSDYEAHLNQNI